MMSIEPILSGAAVRQGLPWRTARHARIIIVARASRGQRLSLGWTALRLQCQGRSGDEIWCEVS